MKIVQNDLSLQLNELEKRDRFSVYFNIVTHEMNVLGPTMFPHGNPITEKSIILFLRNVLNNTYDVIIVSKMMNWVVRFDFKKQEDGARTGD